MDQQRPQQLVVGAVPSGAGGLVREWLGSPAGLVAAAALGTAIVGGGLWWWTTLHHGDEVDGYDLDSDEDDNDDGHDSDTDEPLLTLERLLARCPEGEFGPLLASFAPTRVVGASPSLLMESFQLLGHHLTSSAEAKQRLKEVGAWPTLLRLFLSFTPNDEVMQPWVLRMLCRLLTATLRLHDAHEEPVGLAAAALHAARIFYHHRRRRTDMEGRLECVRFIDELLRHSTRGGESLRPDRGRLLRTFIDALVVDEPVPAGGRDSEFATAMREAAAKSLTFYAFWEQERSAQMAVEVARVPAAIERLLQILEGSIAHDQRNLAECALYLCCLLRPHCNSSQFVRIHSEAVATWLINGLRQHQHATDLVGCEALEWLLNRTGTLFSESEDHEKQDECRKAAHRFKRAFVVPAGQEEMSGFDVLLTLLVNHKSYLSLLAKPHFFITQNLNIIGVLAQADRPALEKARSNDAVVNVVRAMAKRTYLPSPMVEFRCETALALLFLFQAPRQW